MIRKLFGLLIRFLYDFWYLYFTFVSIYFFIFWSVIMRSLNLNVAIDALWGGCYVLVIVSGFLFWKWRRANSILKKLLSEDEIHQVPNILSLTSNERMYQLFIQKQQYDREQLQAQLNENMQDMQDYYEMWAHQIKVPISVLDLMNQTNTVDKYETSSQLIVINQYLDMMLHFIRLKNFNQDLAYQKINVQKLLKSVINGYKFLFIHKNVSISINDVSFTILSDPKWLQFVFEQVVFNAIKYTPQGKINIVCKNDNQVIITDSGIGIAQSDLPMIFTKGYTGFNGRLNSNASGLGLYMVKKILNNLGHDVVITSKVGVGTTVIINLQQVEIK